MSFGFKKSDEWGALLQLLKHGKEDYTFKPILWVGAGLSVPAGYPDTNTLIKLIQKKTLKELPEFLPDDLTYPADSINRSFTLWVQNFAKVNTYGRLNKALASIFSKLPKEPTLTHLELTRNPWKSIFTTNYDQLLEAALDKNGINYNIVTKEDNLGLEQSDLISLYKIHGGLNNINDWTLDEDSYVNFSDKYPFLDAKLKTTLFPNSIVYVGCSMLDPRVIEWYKYCEKHNLSSQLEYSIVIIRKKEWESLPVELKDLYLHSQVNPLFFDTFDEIPNIFSEINSEFLNISTQCDHRITSLEIDHEQRKKREQQLLDDLLYETVAPRIIDIIASIWLEAPESKFYTERLKSLGGARAKNKGEIAFKSLLEDFVELSKKLVGNTIEYINKQNIFLVLDSLFKHNFPSHKVLERINYEPHTLYGSLHVHTTSEDGIYDEDAVLTVFKSLLKDYCELIIDCSLALPTWSEDNLLSQLADPDALFVQLRQELKRWKDKNSCEKDITVLIEDEYRRAIARRFDELKIFGLNFGKRARKYQLSVAYISLTTETDFNDSQENKIYSSEESLTRFERLVILGEAGQGKTTLLQWLTVKCGRQTFSEDKAKWNSKVPVLIQLRKVLNEEELPTNLDFYSLMADAIEVESPHIDWIKTILNNQLAIIMIDGFDEVPKSRRDEVLNWIALLCDKYNGNQFILTSRPSAYEKTSLDGLDFQVIQLQTMDRMAQQQFVEHWHKAIALEYDKLSPNAYDDEAKDLLSQLRNNKPLRNLAENPLLCGVLCMLHHDRSGYLPKDKTDLYESTSRLFLDSRDREKKILEEQRFTSLDFRSKQSFLSDIAYFMTSNEKVSITPKLLRNSILKKLRDMPDLRNELTPDDIVLFFLERSGLLLQVSPSEIQFAHRTFQEFFTAKYIISENESGVLIDNAGNDYWSGTIQLAVGLRTSKKENESYLVSLLDRAADFESKGNSNAAISLYLLVLSCQESMREISPRFLVKLKNIISKIVPPPNAKVRDALAIAGAIAIPYLARPQSPRGIVKDHYCALALIKMGLPEAYVALIEYFKDHRASYIEKICHDIKKMDLDIVLESEIIEVMIEDGIQNYPVRIRVMLSFLAQDIRLLEKDIDIRVLDITYDEWKRLKGLVPFQAINFEKVKVLNLNDWNVDNLSFLSKCVNLESLSLVRTNFSDLTILNHLSKLKHLNISHTKVTDFSGLSLLKSIESLILQALPINDLSPIENLINLQLLDLSNTDVKDIDLLLKLRNLNKINLENTEIKHINRIGHNLKLNYINISNTYICDLSPLTNLINLETILARRSILKNIEPISKMMNLVRLDISFSNISDLSPIKNHSSIKHLSISGTQVVNFEPVLTLINLERLSIRRLKSAEEINFDQLEKLRVIDRDIKLFSRKLILPRITRLKEAEVVKD